MRLWSDEIEAMRPEARESVARSMEAIAAAFAGESEPPRDLHGAALHMRAAFARTYAPVPEAIERTIAGVRCRVFVPDGPATAIYVHFHGGGMIIGAPEMGDSSNLEMCHRYGMAVVSVDYRKAPEHPFPAGPDDGVAVVRWLLDEGVQEFGTDRLLFGGESAGGYMTAAVALRVRDELGAIDKVIGLFLGFGVFDWGRSPSQRGLRADDGPDMLSPEGIVLFGECYLPGLSDDQRRAPHISPLFADLHDLPPAFMSVGTCDHLLDDTLMLAPRWVAAGNELELFIAPDMPHGFQAFPCALTDAWKTALDTWIRARLAA